MAIERILIRQSELHPTDANVTNDVRCVSYERVSNENSCDHQHDFGGVHFALSIRSPVIRRNGNFGPV